MRLLDRSAGDFTTSPSRLDDQMLARMERFTSMPHGIFLVTVPPGSANPHAVFGAQALNLPDKKIITIEDPVEYRWMGSTRST